MSIHQATITFSPEGLVILRRAIDDRQKIMDVEKQLAQMVDEIKLRLEAVPEAIGKIVSTSDMFAGDYSHYVAKLDVRGQLDETLREMRDYGWTKDGAMDFVEDGIFCEAEVICDDLPRFSCLRPQIIKLLYDIYSNFHC